MSYKTHERRRGEILEAGSIFPAVEVTGRARWIVHPGGVKAEDPGGGLVTETRDDRQGLRGLGAWR